MYKTFLEYVDLIIKHDKRMLPGFYHLAYELPGGDIGAEFYSGFAYGYDLDEPEETRHQRAYEATSKKMKEFFDAAAARSVQAVLLQKNEDNKIIILHQKLPESV